jgi:Rrf2 family protein
MSIMAIARSENLSLGYLEQLMAQLRRAGLVEGTRGAKGGYRLKDVPTRITVGRVLRALEGPVAPVTCASEKPEEYLCERESNCPSHEVWQRVRDSVIQVLDSMTLADIVKPRQQKASSS